MIGARRTACAAAVLASAALVAVAAAWAAISPTYTVAGVEVAVTPQEGTFVGVGTGSTGDKLVWKAVVGHTPLSTDPASPATVTGGSLTAASLFEDTITPLTGTFTGGTITFDPALSSSTACGKQVFDVSGTLALAGGSSTGTGSFDVLLTHHRVSLFGRCITFAASVHGAPGLGVSLS
jgi:hypothetical protein